MMFLMNLNFLFIIGIVLGAAGLIGISYCIVATFRIRKEGLEDAELRLRLNRLVQINLASLFVAILGCMFGVIGLLV